ncbi:hypothetical protein ACFVWY_21270 [Streptomyces sp. NPDC058195]|uniref:hypothetical protein n=1 Tax=Streptomyces sp. NPDC058195 TaxID=3346375 RepID=UPI0036EB2ED2
MSAEIVELVEQTGPYLTAAVGAYGVGVLTRAESAAVDATANLGRRILQAVWSRRGERGQAELESAVADVEADPADGDAAAALRQQIKRALREDAELLAELAGLMPAASATVNVTASGERSIAAQRIGTASTGDQVTIKP